MFIDEGDFHASAFILGPDDTAVLIRDMRQSFPLWKFAGGKKQLIRAKRFGKKLRGERPIETVLREMFEETGLRGKKTQTEYLTTVDKVTHRKHYFLSRIDSFRRLIPLSKEYEEAKIFKLEDLLWLNDFHPNYRNIYIRYVQPRLHTNH